MRFRKSVERKRRDGMQDFLDHVWRDLIARHRLPQLHTRSEEHTSELQSQSNIVCRLLLEKKKTHIRIHQQITYCTSHGTPLCPPNSSFSSIAVLISTTPFYPKIQICSLLDDSMR